jgi:hypothetical protein
MGSLRTDQLYITLGDIVGLSSLGLPGSVPVGPVYDGAVSRPQSRWQPCLASGSYLLRDNFRIADDPSTTGVIGEMLRDSSVHPGVDHPAPRVDLA